MKTKTKRSGKPTKTSAKSTRKTTRKTADKSAEHHSASRHATRQHPLPRGTRAKSTDRALPFELRHSDIQGTGAFATRRIRKGERIIEYTGEKITHDESDKRYDDEAMQRHHTFLFTIDDDYVLDGASGGNESRFINHSCEPNCEAIIERKRIFIEAMRPILPGEELTYDYAYEWTEDNTPEDAAKYLCRCGSAKCRGTILKKAG